MNETAYNQQRGTRQTYQPYLPAMDHSYYEGRCYGCGIETDDCDNASEDVVDLIGLG